MKFCKDCKHYEPITTCSKFAVGPYCHAKKGPKVFDVVTGQELGGYQDPRTVRHDEQQCGIEAKWFIPANLDGRLALLEDK